MNIMEKFGGEEKKIDRRGLVHQLKDAIRSALKTRQKSTDNERPGKMTRRAFLAGGVALASQHGIAKDLPPREEESVFPEESDYDVGVEGRRAIKREQGKEVMDERDIDRLAMSLFFEARGEPVLGRKAVLQVHLARLVSGEFGKTILKVLYAHNQFSWTFDKQIRARLEANPLTKEEKLLLKNIRDMVSTTMDIKSPEQVIADLSKLTGLPQNCVDYKNKVGMNIIQMKHVCLRKIKHTGRL
jgi:hypothetical protein